MTSELLPGSNDKPKDSPALEENTAGFPDKEYRQAVVLSEMQGTQEAFDGLAKKRLERGPVVALCFNALSKLLRR